MPIWNIRTRLGFFGFVLLSLFLFSIFGFIIIKSSVEGQDVTVIDAVYWTVITLATLGYYPPGIGLTSTTGMIFTTVIVLSGVVTIFVGVPSVVAPWLDKELSRIGRREKKAVPEGGHIIVVGYGDTAYHTLEELDKSGMSAVVVVDDQNSLDKIDDIGVASVRGEGSDEEVLSSANIHSASGIALVDRDEENIFACLTARKMNPDIPITALARSGETEKLLLKIGANRVVTPKNAIGKTLAKRAVGRYDADVDEGRSLLGDIEMRQYTLSSENMLVGKTLEDTGLGRQTGIVVLGVWRNGNLDVSPQPSLSFKEGDILVVLGVGEQFAALENLFVGVGGDI